MTEVQRIEVGKLTERLRQVDNMLGIARDFGNAHVVQTLEQARHTLLRQTSGTRNLDPVVMASARELRLRQEEAILAARALHCQERRPAARNDQP